MDIKDCTCIIGTILCSSSGVLTDVPETLVLTI